MVGVGGSGSNPIWGVTTDRSGHRGVLRQVRTPRSGHYGLTLDRTGHWGVKRGQDTAVRTLGSDERPVRTLGSERGMDTVVRTLGSDDRPVRTLRSEKGMDTAVRTLGSNTRPDRTLGSRVLGVENRIKVAYTGK